jgi:heme A synthase
VPPVETKVMIEYSHRVVASVVGFLILALVGLAPPSPEPICHPRGAIVALLADRIPAGHRGDGDGASVVAST